MANHGPDQLAAQGRDLLARQGFALRSSLTDYWRAPTDWQFFPKAILQPYAEWLAHAGRSPSDRPPVRGGNHCPTCGGAPQLSVLQAAAGGGSSLEGGSRHLLCATCLGTWSFRRVLCPGCGEEDERKLVYFHSPDFEHLRIDACESCRQYLKSVDLGQLGLAVPLVDEVAGAPLDIWAREHGYRKIELNLVGL